MLRLFRGTVSHKGLSSDQVIENEVARRRFLDKSLGAADGEEEEEDLHPDGQSLLLPDEEETKEEEAIFASPDTAARVTRVQMVKSVLLSDPARAALAQETGGDARIHFCHDISELALLMDSNRNQANYRQRQICEQYNASGAFDFLMHAERKQLIRLCTTKPEKAFWELEAIKTRFVHELAKSEELQPALQGAFALV